MRETSTESVTERGVLRHGDGGWWGALAAGAGSLAASSCAIAHRRGPLPAAPMPRIRPQPAPRRNAPWVTRSASWPGRSSRAKCAKRRMKGHSHGDGTPRIVRAGPSSVKGTRRSFQNRSAETIFRTPP